MTGQADQASQNVPTIFNDYVGEGKKYKTAEEAIASIPHAQSHIAKLEADNKTLREQQQAIEAKLAALLANQTPTSGVTAPAPQVGTAATTVDVEALVAQALVKQQALTQAQANSSKVAAELKQLYADKAESAYVAKAQELGLAVEDLNNMAAKSPQAVLTLFKATAPQVQGMQSSMASASLGTGDSVEALMATLTTDPKTYYSPAHQAKLYKALANQS